MNKVLLTVSTFLILGTVRQLNNYPIQNNQVGYFVHIKFLPVHDDLWEFEVFKILHNKVYVNQDVETARFLIFNENYYKIQAINAQQSNFRLAINQFADWNVLEFEANYLGFQLDIEKDIKPYQQSPNRVLLNVSDIPSSVDWRDNLPIVKDQGACGSCWAFSSIACLEGAYFIKEGRVVSFSAQQLVDCNVFNFGCDGGWMNTAYDYVIKYGIELESDYPYTGKFGSCKYDKAKTVYSPKGHIMLNAYDNDQIAMAVADQPIAATVQADNFVFRFYSTGILDSDQCGTKVNHGVAIVGYTQNVWIVRNSWGFAWGDGGHIRIRRDSGKGAGICGIASIVSYLLI